MRNIKQIENIVKELNGTVNAIGIDGLAFQIKDLRIIASNGLGWDHISVSKENEIPSWNEMQLIKNICFHENEIAYQFHPAKKDYVNIHEYCLHIWKKHKFDMPMPPKILI